MPESAWQEGPRLEAVLGTSSFTTAAMSEKMNGFKSEDGMAVEPPNEDRLAGLDHNEVRYFTRYDFITRMGLNKALTRGVFQLRSSW